VAGAKRAAQIAGRIAQEVIEQGWPVGESLGFEPELRERFHVSRMVFREAVRILEHQQVVRTRRGPRGGVFVTEPTVQAVIDTVVLYLYRIDATADEVIEALIVLEQIACDLATSRLDEHGIERLREVIADTDSSPRRSTRAFHTLVASLSGNSALELFIDVLNRVLVLYARDWRKTSDGNGDGRDHIAIARALMDHDAALARRRVRNHLQAARKRLPDTAKTLRWRGAFRTSADSKLSEEVARGISDVMMRRRLQPGDLIGGEEELIEGTRVSRDVFREAVRLLEHQRIAEMRRGHGGGLFVVEPSIAPVAEITAIYLAWVGMDIGELSDLRTELETATVMLAAERISDAGRSRLRDALDREMAAGDVPSSDAVHDLHTAIAAVAANRVLELIALVLILLTRLYGVDRVSADLRKELLAEVQNSHHGIATAVEEGDRVLARSRMRAHLEAIATLMRKS